jgi:hypothetical protein
MFIDLFIDPFSEGIKGILLGIFIWLLSITFVFIIVGSVLYLIDCAIGTKKQGVGIIVDRNFDPAHTTHHHSGKHHHTTHYPDRWYVSIKVEDLSDQIQVNELYYNESWVGDSVNIKYTKGKIFDAIYIDEIK